MWVWSVDSWSCQPALQRIDVGAPPPSLGEARAPGLALGKPSGYTLLAPFLVTHRVTPTIHHGACFEAMPAIEPCCIKWDPSKAVHANFLPDTTSLDWILLQLAFHFSRSVFSKASGHFHGTPAGRFNYAGHAWKNIMRQIAGQEIKSH